MNYLFPVLPYSPNNGNAGKLFSHVGKRIKDILSGSTRGEDSGESPEVKQVKNIYNRLANGILDGALSVLEFDYFTLATGHIHKLNDDVTGKLGESITEKPFMLLGDMNVKKGGDILTHPPFATPDWKSALDPETRTFGFRPGSGLGNRMAMELSHSQPDVLIARGFVFKRVATVKSLSDHDGISAILAIK